MNETTIFDKSKKVSFFMYSKIGLQITFLPWCMVLIVSSFLKLAVSTRALRVTNRLQSIIWHKIINSFKVK